MHYMLLFKNSSTFQLLSEAHSVNKYILGMGFAVNNTEFHKTFSH